MTVADRMRGWFLAALLLTACDGSGQPTAAGNRVAVLPLEQAAPATAFDFPALTGRVVDAADLLRPEEEGELSDRLAALERHTTDQLVVATVPSLHGRAIEDYSRALANHWGIGQAETDNGVLLVVAPRERQVRIAVGYGLEPILTNARSREIVDRDLLPAFRDGRWREGIATGVDAIAQLLLTEADQPRQGRP